MSSSRNLITENVSLADKTWFKTGGPARFYSEPCTTHEFQEAVLYATAYNLPIFVLGEGANILISDEGFNGLVIRPQLQDISHYHEGEHSFVKAGAGVSFQALIDYCLKHNLLGLEEFSGIPGTVGGSVFINIHYFEFLLSSFLDHATVIEKQTGNRLTVDSAWFNFGYNYSLLHEEKHYLAQAVFKLCKGSDLEAAYARGRQREIIRHRSHRYPSQRTCGSFFRNFHDHEVTLVSNGKKIIYVAYYFDKVGIKGHLSVGGASVSYKHANMIVSTEKSTTCDIIGVARTMQCMVKDTFGILPQPECRLVGFKEYPLLVSNS